MLLLAQEHHKDGVEMEHATFVRASIIAIVAVLSLKLIGFDFLEFFWLLFYGFALFLLGFVYTASLYGKSYLRRHKFPLLTVPKDYFTSRFWYKDQTTRPKLPKLDRRLTGCSQVDEQLQDILQYIFRDFIFSWYSYYFKNDAEFPHYLRAELHNFIIDFSALCKDINWLQICTEDLVNEFAAHVKLYRNATKTPEKDRTTEQIFFQLEEKEIGYSRAAVCIGACKMKLVIIFNHFAQYVTFRVTYLLQSSRTNLLPCDVAVIKVRLIEQQHT